MMGQYKFFMHEFTTTWWPTPLLCRWRFSGVTKLSTVLVFSKLDGLADIRGSLAVEQTVMYRYGVVRGTLHVFLICSNTCSSNVLLQDDGHSYSVSRSWKGQLDLRLAWSLCNWFLLLRLELQSRPSFGDRVLEMSLKMEGKWLVTDLTLLALPSLLGFQVHRKSGQLKTLNFKYSNYALKRRWQAVLSPTPRCVVLTRAHSLLRIGSLHIPTHPPHGKANI